MITPNFIDGVAPSRHTTSAKQSEGVEQAQPVKTSTEPVDSFSNASTSSAPKAKPASTPPATSKFGVVPAHLLAFANPRHATSSTYVPPTGDKSVKVGRDETIDISDAIDPQKAQNGHLTIFERNDNVPGTETYNGNDSKKTVTLGASGTLTHDDNNQNVFVANVDVLTETDGRLRADIGNFYQKNNSTKELDDTTKLTFSTGGGAQYTGNIGGIQAQLFAHKNLGVGGATELKSVDPEKGLQDIYGGAHHLTPIVSAGVRIDKTFNEHLKGFAGADAIVPLSLLGQTHLRAKAGLQLGSDDLYLRANAGVEWLNTPRQTVNFESDQNGFGATAAIGAGGRINDFLYTGRTVGMDVSYEVFTLSEDFIKEGQLSFGLKIFLDEGSGEKDRSGLE